jgi:hypothetical protein
MPGLFNKKILQQRIKNYTIENIEKKIKQIKNWQKSLENYNINRIENLN